MGYRDYAYKLLGKQNCQSFERAYNHTNKEYLVVLETEKCDKPVPL
jgi:hypothetical protein